MELGDFLSPVASLVVGFFGAVLGVRQSNAAWQREQDQKRIYALRSYERALYDMALYLEGVEIPDFRGHPEPKDLDKMRQAAFPYFAEFEGKDYYRLLAPTPTGRRYSAMEDSDEYAAISRIIKQKLDDEAQVRGRGKFRRRFDRLTRRPNVLARSQPSAMTSREE